jgi:hypothetical protein
MTRWLILLALGLGPVVTPQAPSPAEATFARIKNMAGTWTAHSTKGWDEDLRLQVIAGGSAVLETSFDAHPGETMATLFYLDGPRLMLTHYCVAKNQPRLMATSFEDDNRTVTFTFVDAWTRSSTISRTTTTRRRSGRGIRIRKNSGWRRSTRRGSGTRRGESRRRCG